MGRDSDRPITLRLNWGERALLYNALQDLIVVKEDAGKEEEVADLWDLFNRVEKLPTG